MKLAIALTFIAVTLAAIFSVSAPAETSTVILSKNNTLVLNEEVNDESTTRIMSSLSKMNTSGPIYLVLDTPGGSISSGLELIDYIKGSSKNVKTITIFAASMGFQIVQNLGERLIVPRGELMSHKAHGQFSAAEFGGAEPTQYTNRYQHWVNKINELDKITVIRTKGKQTLESYQKAYENELWLTANQAVSQGYSDKVVDVTCDSSLSGTTYKTVQYMGLDIRLEISSCPIITGILGYSVDVVTNQGKMSLTTFKTLGGKMGNDCVKSTNITQLCTVDVTLTEDKINDIVKKYISEMKNKRNYVM